MDLKRNLQASLGCPAVLASPGQALALYESNFGNAQQSETACCLFWMTTCRKLWRGANNIVGAWGHMPLAWPVPHELEGEIVGVDAMDVLRDILSTRSKK